MQPDASSVNFFLNPDGKPEAPPVAAAALRGLAILQAALVIELCSGLLSNASRAYLLSAGAGLRSSFLMSTLMMAWQLVFIGTSVAELVALSTLAGAPPESRIAQLARPALWLRTVGLLLTLFSSYALPRLADRLGSSHEQLQAYIYTSYAETVISLLGTVLIIEVLLRLRRFAAPTDVQSVQSESLVRGGLLAAVVARLIANYASYPLGSMLFGSETMRHWGGLVVRMPFTILVYGLLLWLVQATATALRSYKPAAADGGAPLAGPTGSAAPADTSSAAYRNMLFGGLWAMGGIAMSLLTYQNAHQLGGRYVVAYGAIVAGIIQFIRGLIQLSSRQ